MKTYTKTVQETKPRLEIWHDESADNPRYNDNLGYFITCDSRLRSPDSNEVIEAIVKVTGEEAKSVQEHIDMITKRIKDRIDEKVVTIYPISKYEHGNVRYSIGQKHGFDYSNNGFYIVTDKTAKSIGAKAKSFEAIITAELSLYNAYVNGEVYGYTLYDKKGDEIESTNGYYGDYEQIRSSLPKEWAKEDLSKYLI